MRRANSIRPYQNSYPNSLHDPDVSSYPLNPGSFHDLGLSSHPFNPGSTPIQQKTTALYPLCSKRLTKFLISVAFSGFSLPANNNLNSLLCMASSYKVFSFSDSGINLGIAFGRSDSSMDTNV